MWEELKQKWQAAKAALGVIKAVVVDPVISCLVETVKPVAAEVVEVATIVKDTIVAIPSTVASGEAADSAQGAVERALPLPRSSPRPRRSSCSEISTSMPSPGAGVVPPAGVCGWRRS